MFDYIFHIPNFVENSNGIQTLWEAAYQFSKKREVAIIPYYAGEIRKYPIPSKYRALVKHGMVAGNDSIVIYPDACHGNPLHAKRVARYLLAKEYILDGHEINYSSKDFIFSYSNAVSSLCPQYNILLENLSALNRYHSNKNLNKISIYYGKCRIGNNLTSLKRYLNNFDDISIITRSNPSSRDELYQTIADSKILISFDPLTSLCYEATLIGTPTVLMDSVFKESYQNYNYPLHGFYYEDECVDIRAIIENSANLKDLANVELIAQLNGVENKTVGIINEIESYFSRPNRKNNFKNIKQDDQTFYSQKWLCSPILNCTTLNTVCGFHLLNKSPFVFSMVSLCFTTKKRIKSLLFKIKNYVFKTLKTYLKWLIGDSPYIIAAYKASPNRHANRFACREVEQSQFSNAPILKPNKAYNFLAR